MCYRIKRFEGTILQRPNNVDVKYRFLKDFINEKIQYRLAVRGLIEDNNCFNGIKSTALFVMKSDHRIQIKDSNKRQLN